MKTIGIGVVVAFVVTASSSACFAEATNYTFTVLRNGVINDTVVDAIAPSGVATTRSGRWLLSFGDKGDCTAGCKVYLCESQDAGQTWSQPYKTIAPDNELQGLDMPLFSLDDGCILGAKNVFTYEDNTWDRRGFRTSRIMMMASQDEGRSFTLLQVLKTPERSIVSCMNALVRLKNGDMILPAYCYPKAGTGRQPGSVYGSGFFRSRDGGKTWGGFELAFKEVSGAKRMSFNESAFAVKAGGTLVGFARIDSRPVNNMWKITSQDHGTTWTMPVETEIRGNYPEIKRLNNGLYLMVCGVCKTGGGRPTVFFLSEDGENYEQVGRVYYSRPEYFGGRRGGGAGGTQSIIPVGENRAYAVYYGGDLGLKGKMCTYIDGCLIEVRRRAHVTRGPADCESGSVRPPPSPMETVSLLGDIKLDLLYVAPGSLTNASPVKEVACRAGYYLGKHEITQAQYQAVMKTNPACFKKDNHPVDCVSWHDALAFCEALTRIERHAGRLSDKEVYRLPTEVEWEFAARGGNSSRNYAFSGGDKINEVAWKQGNSDYEPHEVGRKKANELGFCDMSGNVWEWTDDCYSDAPAYAGGGHYAREMAICGGDCNSLAVLCRISSRSNVAPARRLRGLGFRILRTLSKE